MAKKSKARSKKASDDSGSGSGVYPELLICLAAAVGTDTGVVTDALSAELRSVGYQPVPIRLSHLMSELQGLKFMRQLKRKMFA
jgi:hypothetical protein